MNMLIRVNIFGSYRSGLLIVDIWLLFLLDGVSIVILLMLYVWDFLSYLMVIIGLFRVINIFKIN